MRFSWIYAFLSGAWQITNRSDPTFYIQKDVITTKAESAIFTMKPEWKENQQLYLSNLVILKRPNDWMNIVKYRKKIYYYNIIKNHGLTLNISFVNDSLINVTTILDKENLEFTMEKISQEDIE
jgi:hypothetical protein